MVFCFSPAALTKKVTVNLCFNFLLPFACFHFSANHTNEISTKLIKGNAMLSKLRHFVNKDILLSVYYGIFHSHLAYLCLVWGQAKFSLNRITLLQKRAIRILHSAAYWKHTSPLFHRYKVLKFVDLLLLENCIFVNKCFNDEAFSLFSNHFKLTRSSHSYCTRSLSNGLTFKRVYNTSLYGNKSITFQMCLVFLAKKMSHYFS